jgi:hypothetical protein
MNNINLNNLKLYLKEQHEISNNILISEIAQNPLELFEKILSNQITSDTLVHLIKSHPEIIEYQHQGLSFIHYIILKDDYDFTRRTLICSLQNGLKNIPLTGSTTCSTKYKPNQSIVNFMFEQNCLESFKAIMPFLQLEDSSFQQIFVESFVLNKNRWTSFFKKIYLPQDIEKFNYSILVDKPHLVEMALKTYDYDIKKLKNLALINIFNSYDSDKGSLLYNCFSHTNIFYLKTNLENSFSKIDGEIQVHSNKFSNFLEKIILDVQFNPQERPSKEKNTLFDLLDNVMNDQKYNTLYSYLSEKNMKLIMNNENSSKSILKF